MEVALLLTPLAVLLLLLLLCAIVVGAVLLEVDVTDIVLASQS
jgi:hypothetical protein